MGLRGLLRGATSAVLRTGGIPIALAKDEKLVGGGMTNFVNTTVARVLRKLGYEAREVADILKHIDENATSTWTSILPVFALLCGCAATRPLIRPEAYVGLQRFMGTWHVIANIPTWFEVGAYNAVES